MVRIFVIILTILSGHTQARDRFRDDPIPVTVLDTEALTLKSLFPSRRIWTKDDEVNIRSSFQTWKTCHEARINNNELPSSCYCAQGTSSPLDIDLNFIGLMSCVPDHRDGAIAFSKDLRDSEKKERDDLICECLRSGRSFDLVGLNPPTKTDVKKLGDEIQQRIDSAGLGRRGEHSLRSRISSAIHAMNIADSTGRALRLGGVYIAEESRIADKIGKSGVEKIQASVNEIMSSVSDDRCIPYSDFLSHVQYSEDPEFYSSLNGGFKEDEWDYAKLLKRLGNYQTYNGAVLVPENRWIIARMKFLHNNPAYKNLFASHDQKSSAKKNELFQILKSNYPRPDCRENGCLRNEGWAKQAVTFKEKVSKFLSQGEVNDDIQTGIKNLTQLELASQEARVAAQLETPFSDNLGDNPSAVGSSDWQTFCRLRDKPDRRIARSKDVSLLLLASLEEKFGRNYSSPTNDSQYQKVNEAYCKNPRLSPEGKEMRFIDFKKSCASQSHRACLKSFISSYPYDKTGPRKLELSTFINDLYLNEGILTPELQPDQIERAVAIGSSPDLRRNSMSELTSGNFPSDSFSSRASIPSVREATAVSSSRDSSPQTSSQIAQAQEIFSPVSLSQSGPTPELPTANTLSSQSKEQLSQANNEAQELKEEIASLRQQMEAREKAVPASTDTDTLLRELRAKLSIRESELLAKNQEVRNLQNRSRFADEDDSEDSEEEARPKKRNVNRSTASVQDGSTNSPSLEPASQQAAQIIGPANSGNVNSGVNGGGVASLGSARSGGTASGSRSLNKELLSINNKREAGQSNGITVDQNADSISKNSDGDQAAGSVIPFTVTPQDFNELKNSNELILTRFKDQLMASPSGEYTLNLRDNENRVLEVVVRKVNGILTIVKAPVERNATLDGLNRGIAEEALTH